MGQVRKLQVTASRQSKTREECMIREKESSRGWRQSLLIFIHLTQIFVCVHYALRLHNSLLPCYSCYFVSAPPTNVYCSSLSCVVLLVYIDIPDPSTNTKSRFSLMSKYRVCLPCCSSTNLLEDIRSGVKLVTGGHWWTCCQMVFAADAEAHRADSTEWQGGEAAG